MHYAEIAEQIFERGLRTGQTATPAATVRSTITQSFKNDGDGSPFIRVGPGVYALWGIQIEASAIAREELAPTETSEVTGLVNAFGMFWDRKKGGEAEFMRADVRREEDVRNLIDKTVERFGRLDHLSP